MIAALDGGTTLPCRLVGGDQRVRIDLESASGIRRDIGTGAMAHDAPRRAEQQTAHLVSGTRCSFRQNGIQNGA